MVENWAVFFQNCHIRLNNDCKCDERWNQCHNVEFVYGTENIPIKFPVLNVDKMQKKNLNLDTLSHRIYLFQIHY